MEASPGRAAISSGWWLGLHRATCKEDGTHKVCVQDVCVPACTWEIVLARAHMECFKLGAAMCPANPEAPWRGFYLHEVT
eukprot:3298409-Karenia_brevis.AAC.1